MRAFERRFACLAMTLSFRDNIWQIEHFSNRKSVSKSFNEVCDMWKFKKHYGMLWKAERDRSSWKLLACDILINWAVFPKTVHFVHLSLQTYLEAAKTKFKKDYKSLNSSKITTTVGLNIGQVDVAGIRINFWDLGGQEDLQSLWDKVRKVSSGSTAGT